MKDVYKWNLFKNDWPVVHKLCTLQSQEACHLRERSDCYSHMQNDIYISQHFATFALAIKYLIILGKRTFWTQLKRLIILWTYWKHDELGKFNSYKSELVSLYKCKPDFSQQLDLTWRDSIKEVLKIEVKSSFSFCYCFANKFSISSSRMGKQVTFME